MSLFRDGPGKALVAAVLAAGAFLHVVLTGLVAPPAAVVAGMVVGGAAVWVMVWRLRKQDPYALAVPIAFVVAWQLLVFLGMFLFGWAP